MEKLVRDLIPEVMKKKGQQANYRIAEQAEYEISLSNKLLEEVHEFIQNPSMEELADILEVIESIKCVKGFKTEEIESVRLEKKRERGGFNEKIILECKG